MNKLTSFLKRHRRKILLWLLVLSTIGILVGTLFPVNYTLPETVFGLDKVGHFIMFGTWTFLYGMIQLLRKKPNFWLIFTYGTLFGLVIELLQLILPTNRSVELFDFVSDVLGVGFAILALNLLVKKFPKLQKEALS